MGDSKKRHHKIHPEEENLDQLSIRPIQADDSRQICKRYSQKNTRPHYRHRLNSPVLSCSFCSQRKCSDCMSAKFNRQTRSGDQIYKRERIHVDIPENAEAISVDYYQANCDQNDQARNDIKSEKINVNRKTGIKQMPN